MTLTLRPTARAKARLRKTGKLPVTLRLTFTPDGREGPGAADEEGDAAQVARQLTS